MMDIIGKESGELAANQIKIDDSTLGTVVTRREKKNKMIILVRPALQMSPRSKCVVQFPFNNLLWLLTTDYE